MSEPPYNDDIPSYEQQSSRSSGRYLFSFKDGHYMPEWIWDSLPGVIPQKQRAYSLQSRYVMPLDFSLGFLQAYRQIAYFILMNLVFKELWNNFTLWGKIIIVLLFLCAGLLMGVYYYAQRKNTRDIREEVFYFNTVTIISYLISLLVINTEYIIPFVKGLS
nr:hypothetical protein [uncultured Flavobacterium sp.]